MNSFLFTLRRPFCESYLQISHIYSHFHKWKGPILSIIKGFWSVQLLTYATENQQIHARFIDKQGYKGKAIHLG